MEKNFKGLMKGLLVIVIATAILRIFLPWWAVALFSGATIVAILYGIFTKTMGIENSPWPKRVAIGAVVIFAVSSAGTYIDYKWPWLGKAIEDRQLYSSYQATDKVSPGYPNALAMTLYRTELTVVEAEEARYRAALEAIQTKLNKGGQLDDNDKNWLAAAKQRLPELDKELSSARLARPNNGSWIKSIQNNSVGKKFLFFGAVLAAISFLINRFSKEKKKIVGLAGLVGGLTIIIGFAFLIFGSPTQIFASVSPAPAPLEAAATPTGHILKQGSALLFEKIDLAKPNPRIFTRPAGSNGQPNPRKPWDGYWFRLDNSRPMEFEVLLQLQPGTALADFPIREVPIGFVPTGPPTRS